MNPPRNNLLLTSSLPVALIGIILMGGHLTGNAQEEEGVSHQQIQLRVEFYDLPAAEALRIQQKGIPSTEPE